MTALLLLLLFLISCSSPRPATPPAADFLLVSGDSTYWVTSKPGGLDFRGSPLILARYGGRFHELYVVDDDDSYQDALLIGQTVFSRDLVTDDSTPIFGDTLIGRITRAYAAAHPDLDPLDPDEPVNDDPSLTATSDVTLLDEHGPYLSLEYHADTRHRPRPAFHTTWRAVIDMRTGRPVPLADLVGPAAAAAATARARRDFGALIDSARASRAELPDLVPLLLNEARFDSTSYTIAPAGRALAVQFAARLAGLRDAVDALMLAPVTVQPPPAWWPGVAATLPLRAGAGAWEWARPGYTVRAVRDTADSVLDLTVTDTARHVWRVGRVHEPLRHVFWMDQPRADSTTRRALDRAFNDATFYDDDVHVARLRRAPRAAPRFRIAAARASSSPPRSAARRVERRRPTSP
ncbi:MAG: hypothetical protein KGN74_05045 [Gemmatimonadota bacterium]|nr:hypothetical protein [Gemmatimonadota bacterium]MDE3217275.1 hypothetical protein [Gemmatimonadota bacterium]